nr:DNA recombination protein RmuC [Pseudomonadota bacterium]
MTQTSLLLIVLLVAVVVVIVLLLVVLTRKPHVRLEQALRDEQRDGRGELRQQLDGMALAQEQRIEGFGGRLNALTARTDQQLTILREALNEDARKSRSESGEQQQRSAEAIGQRLTDLTQRNEQRIGEMRTTL